MVKFLAGESAHAPKVTIFKVLLLQNGDDWWIQTFRNESQNQDLALGSERGSIGLNHVWISVMFSSAGQFLDIFLDLQFLLCILIRYLLKCTKNLASFFLEKLSAAAKISKLLQKRVPVTKTPQCALDATKCISTNWY